MTVAQGVTAPRYLGLSTDTKPTTNVPIGDMFRETDTHYDYIFNGSAWQGPCYWLGICYPFEEH